MADLTTDQLTALLAEVKADPTGVGYVDTAALGLPNAQTKAAVAAKGSTFEAKVVLLDAAIAAKKASPQDAAKQTAYEAALVVAKTAETELESANQAVDDPHRAIDAAALLLATSLNDKTNGAGTVAVGLVALQDVVGAIAAADTLGLDDNAMKVLDVYLRGSVVDSASQNVRDALFGVFPDGTPTNQNLRAIFDRPASRAELLFGAGTEIHPWDIARAIRADKIAKGG